MIVNIYKNNKCVDTFKIICNSKYVSNIDVQLNHIIIGTISGEVFIYNMEIKNIVSNFYTDDCVTCLKFINQEYFIVATMNNQIFLANVNGNISLPSAIDSYIMSIHKISENTFVTGCVFGNIQHWKINFEFMNIQCIKENVKCIDSIHSIIKFNDKFIVGSSNDNKIYFANSNEILYTHNDIISIQKLDDKYFMVLYNNGFLTFYDKNYQYYKNIFIHQNVIENVCSNQSKICVFEDKIFIHVDEYLYLIY